MDRDYTREVFLEFPSKGYIFRAFVPVYDTYETRRKNESKLSLPLLIKNSSKENERLRLTENGTEEIRRKVPT